MVKILEISVFKIISIHTGIFSLILAWFTLSFEGVIGVSTKSISADYNFIGYLTRMDLEALDMRGPEVIKMTLLTLFGIVYIIGFLLTLVNIKVDKKDDFKILGYIGLVIVSIGIIGYVLALPFLLYQNQLIFGEDILSLYPAWDLIFKFNAGFFLAIATLILIIFELFFKYQIYFLISLSKSKTMFSLNYGEKLAEPNQKFYSKYGSEAPLETPQLRTERSRQLSTNTSQYSPEFIYLPISRQMSVKREEGPYSKKCLGFGIASLIIVLISFAFLFNHFFFISFLIFFFTQTILNIVGLTFGILSKVNSKKAGKLESLNPAERTGSAFAIIGIVINAILIIIRLLTYLPMFFIPNFESMPFFS
ncbi:hypothetical protein LCGC14_0811810 [marine sediment metagenome]|uniref:Uncharacterized protein n=1 Tax=marine sediment metagenome TaxID=412755 RepID=A0A0F9PLG8_9ZZZZ